ncbi:Hypothetical predicted protein [Mytilus galloprovincialis]|uniref:Uncharacterized protein n=1 Tax=Mytilus galloprovincialis TaxID=29158 RepID=A0A8B6G2R0_MYTGA|nr:Hypothetical predicted protein [Mytilus galloprovincialis]
MTITMVFSFLPCTSMCVTGQTGSGKTRFVYRLLRHVKDMYADEPPEAILYCYGIHQSAIRGNGKDDSRHRVSRGPTFDGDDPRIHRRQTSPPDRAG